MPAARKLNDLRIIVTEAFGSRKEITRNDLLQVIDEKCGTSPYTHKNVIDALIRTGLIKAHHERGDWFIKGG